MEDIQVLDSRVFDQSINEDDRRKTGKFYTPSLLVAKLMGMALSLQLLLY